MACVTPVTLEAVCWKSGLGDSAHYEERNLGTRAWRRESRRYHLARNVAGATTVPNRLLRSAALGRSRSGELATNTTCVLGGLRPRNTGRTCHPSISHSSATSALVVWTVWLVHGVGTLGDLAAKVQVQPFTEESSC
uniref:(northern house mosquito) hypothetical protein n=1 Tax=Culex pipiens TaxID=7175 RepID=A0A8D8MD37_CULPI